MSASDERRMAEDVASDLYDILRARVAYRRVLERLTFRECRDGSPMGMLSKAIRDYLGREHDALADGELSSWFDYLEDDGSRRVQHAEAEYGRTTLSVLAADVYGVTPADYVPPSASYFERASYTRKLEAAE